LRRAAAAAPYYNRGVHFVYIVRCADGTLYTGYARDPAAREQVHNRGRGARYTAGRRPVRLVYSESFASIGDALRRERQLKRLRRSRKEALVRLPTAGNRKSEV
jgi:putative endonuclease